MELVDILLSGMGAYLAIETINTIRVASVYFSNIVIPTCSRHYGKNYFLSNGKSNLESMRLTPIAHVLRNAAIEDITVSLSEYNV